MAYPSKDMDEDEVIRLMHPAGKELDANPKKEYSLFYCWRSQTFKLDEDKDEDAGCSEKQIIIPTHILG